jgi:protease IV
MANVQLLSKIIRGIWLMDKQAAESYMPLVFQFISGRPLTVDQSEREENTSASSPYAISANLHTVKRYNSFNDAPPGSIAVIPVSGALQKADYCGTPGTNTLSQRLIQADAHPNIKGSILLIDSPGGHVDGTQDFSKAVKATGKPVVSLVDGLMASAAYWIGSSADEIIIKSETSLIGSIGTMITLADFKGYYEKEGLKIHDVFAEQSKDKNKIFAQVMEGNYKPIQEQLLNPMNELFLSAVRENRSGKITDESKVLTGEIFIASQAIENGLADHMGDFAFAVERINALAGEEEDTNTNTNMKIDMSKYPTFAKALGMESAEGSDEGLHLNAEHLGTIETLLIDGAKASGQVGTLTSEKEALTGQVTTLTKERNDATTKVAELEAAHVPAPGQAANAEQEDADNAKTPEFHSEADAELDAFLNDNKED